MKIIHVQITGVRVSKFYPREALVEIEVSFISDKPKHFHKTIQVQHPGSLANRVLLEITTIEKSALITFDGETLLEGSFNIVFKDEREVKRKLTKFFSELRTRVEKVKEIKMAEGYLGAINSVQSMRVTL